MEIYWHLKNVPELAQLTREERRRMWRQAYWKTYRHWETWVGLLALAGGMSLGRHFGATYGHSFMGGMVGGSIGGVVLWQTAIHVARQHYFGAER